MSAAGSGKPLGRDLKSLGRPIQLCRSPPPFSPSFTFVDLTVFWPRPTRLLRHTTFFVSFLFCIVTPFVTTFSRGSYPSTKNETKKNGQPHVRRPDREAPLCDDHRAPLRKHALRGWRGWCWWRQRWRRHRWRRRRNRWQWRAIEGHRERRAAPGDSRRDCSERGRGDGECVF